MLMEATKLEEAIIVAQDGEFGRVEQLYFDDEKWTVRYLVIKTEGKLEKQRVLISPISLKQVDLYGKRIWVDLTKEQIEGAPSADEHWPVSRQYEESYFNYYQWPPYWGQADIWVLGPYGMSWPSGNAFNEDQGPMVRNAIEMTLNRSQESRPHDPHLRTDREIIGLKLKTSGDVFGHIEDLLLDDRSWSFRYLVADTINYFPSRSVLLPIELVDSINWMEKNVALKVDKGQVRSASTYEPRDINFPLPDGP